MQRGRLSSTCHSPLVLGQGDVVEPATASLAVCPGELSSHSPVTNTKASAPQHAPRPQAAGSEGLVLAHGRSQGRTREDAQGQEAGGTEGPAWGWGPGWASIQGCGAHTWGAEGPQSKDSARTFVPSHFMERKGQRRAGKRKGEGSEPLRGPLRKPQAWAAP